jgi:hypothetical protein
MSPERSVFSTSTSCQRRICTMGKNLTSPAGEKGLVAQKRRRKRRGGIYPVSAAVFRHGHHGSGNAGDGRADAHGKHQDPLTKNPVGLLPPTSIWGFPSSNILSAAYMPFSAILLKITNQTVFHTVRFRCCEDTSVCKFRGQAFNGCTRLLKRCSQTFTLNRS